MLYGIPYNSPAAFPVVVLVVYLILTFVRIISSYAKTLSTTQRLPQKNTETSSVTPVGKESAKEFLRDFSSTDVHLDKSTDYHSSGRDSDSETDENEVVKQQTQSPSHAAREPGIGGNTQEFYDAQDHPSTISLHGSLPNTQFRGTATDRGIDASADFKGLSPSSGNQPAAQGSKPQGFGGARPKTRSSEWDTSNSAVLHPAQPKSCATQIYLKTQEIGTYPRFIIDTEESEKLFYDFAQTVIQKSQKYMFQQLEQSIQ